MSHRIMIVDDEAPIRESLQGLFEDEGFLVYLAASGEEAVAKLRKQSVDCVLLDIWMPGIDGLETLSRLRQLDESLPVIMMSGHATIDTAVRATRQGAFDFVEKPISFDHMLILVRNALERRRLELENRNLRAGQQAGKARTLVGESAVMREVRALIERVAASDAPVLILGEHGCGKTVAAMMLHQMSRRKDGPFVELNSASVPEGRMDSELFGHEKGAFPGALHTRRGCFERAHQGSLFIDEVADLALPVQAKVVRILQERRVYRLGSVTPFDADVRLLAASSKDLEREMRAGKVREDFYYRLNVVEIRMPPLREHSEDIPLLVEALAGEQAGDLGGEPVRFSDDAMMRLCEYHWPGNVRELRNYIERCQILMPGRVVDVGDMPPLDHQAAPAGGHVSMAMDEGFHAARERFERSYLLHHLQAHDWNVSRTAAAIGMERSQLHRKMKHFGLSAPARKGA